MKETENKFRVDKSHNKRLRESESGLTIFVSIFADLEGMEKSFTMSRDAFFNISLNFLFCFAV